MMEQVHHFNTYLAPATELEAAISRFFSMSEYPSYNRTPFPEAMQLTAMTVDMPVTHKLYALDTRLRFLKDHFSQSDFSEPVTEQEQQWYEEYVRYKVWIPDYFEYGLPENFSVPRDETPKPIEGWNCTDRPPYRLLREAAEHDGVRQSFLFPDIGEDRGRYPEDLFDVVPEVAMMLVESFNDSKVSWWRENELEDLERVLNHIIDPEFAPTYDNRHLRYAVFNGKHTKSTKDYWDTWKQGTYAMSQNYDKIGSIKALYPEELQYGVGESLATQMGDFAIAAARFDNPSVHSLPYFRTAEVDKSLIYYEEHYSIVEEGVREIQELFGFWSLVAHLRGEGDLRAIKDPRYSFEEHGSAVYDLIDMGGRLPQGGHVYLRPFGSMKFDPKFEYGSILSGIAATINCRAPVLDNGTGLILPFSLRAERDGRPKPRQIARTYRRTDAAPDPGFEEGDATAEVGSVSHDFGSINDVFISPKLVAAGNVARVDAEGLSSPDFHHGRHFFADHLGRAGVFAGLVLKADRALSDLAPTYSERRQLRASGVLK